MTLGAGSFDVVLWVRTMVGLRGKSRGRAAVPQVRFEKVGSVIATDPHQQIFPNGDPKVVSI